MARYAGQLPPFVRDDTDAMIVLLTLCSTRYRADEIERRVVAHVREYERITGVLVKTSTAQRGPGVGYGRCPRCGTRSAGGEGGS
jgi:hypothetical protein